MPKITKRLVDATEPAKERVYVWIARSKALACKYCPAGSRATSTSTVAPSMAIIPGERPLESTATR